MLYTLLNERENYYLNLHGERMLWSYHRAYEEDGGTGPVDGAVFKELAAEKLKRERIFIDFRFIDALEGEGGKALAKAIRKLLERDNKICVVRAMQGVWQEIESCLQGAGICCHEKQGEAGEWYLSAGLAGQELSGPDIGLWERLIKEIHKDNLLILMHESPTGKSFDVKRILEDGEACLYYFFYRLSMKMQTEGLVPADEEARNKICLIPDTQPAVHMVRILSKLLGVRAEWEEPLADRIVADTEYIIVRDVIHMAFQLEKYARIAKVKNASIIGSACLLDINTGVGSRNVRVSLHTIDLEKGISYRLRQKTFTDIEGDF